MKKNNNMTYQEAVKELETIVGQIEKEDIPVDELLQKVKRSSELIRYCQNKLTQTEEEVGQVLQNMKKETGSPDNAKNEEAPENQEEKKNSIEAEEPPEEPQD